MTKNITLNWKWHKEGVIIYAKSKEFNDLFASRDTFPKYNSKRITLSVREIPQFNDNITDYALMYRHGSLKYSNDIPNLSILRCAGIDKGVYMVIKGVFTLEEMKDYIKIVNNTLPYIYKTIKRGVISV